MTLDPGAQPTEAARTDLDDGVVGMTVPARVGAERVDVAAIPYYAWGNRSPEAMRVWIPSQRS